MENAKKIPLLCIVGPTASGKTGLSIALAKELKGEIISADSMQIYKGMPIASAAPTKEEKGDTPHHLFEFLEPDTAFSVADYVNLAHKTIYEVYSRGKLPILVGGTGLYVNSVVDNIQFTEEPFDDTLRKKLEAEMDAIGAEEMLKKLAEFDKETAEKLHANNRRRIIRAFEVYYQTGKTITEQNALSKQIPSPYDTIMLGMTYRDREKLYERINLRVDKMLENGLLEEAKQSVALVGRGAGQAIGHKELLPYISGECSLDFAVENLKRETRRYAKRQLTWFNRDERINWLYADECDVLSEAKKIVRRFANEG
ncbi:MAG: tRNA (adenosine(37)-N6)-dimethylallyltransferase MiaA [Clostridia bacterium]|nr:tRNA (adenosine(37)-N6)-dimethylallyltransferase MiaA [Clostridia bacterium]